MGIKISSCLTKSCRLLREESAIDKWTKDQNRPFTNEKQMASKHIERTNTIGMLDKNQMNFLFIALFYNRKKVT